MLGVGGRESEGPLEVLNWGRQAVGPVCLCFWATLHGAEESVCFPGAGHPLLVFLGSLPQVKQARLGPQEGAVSFPVLLDCWQPG